MIPIVCTLIVCATVSLLFSMALKVYIKMNTPAQQPSITEEELSKAYRDAEADKVPDFQDVIDFINKEFTGVEDSDE